MNRVFKELPIVFPFYEQERQKSERRENAHDMPYKLISYRNAVLPFQIEVDSTKANPTYCAIVDDSGVHTPIRLNQFQVYEYSGKKNIIYNGDVLYRTNDVPLNLVCGYYYMVFSFADMSALFSEVFYVPEFSFLQSATSFGNCVKFEFWNDSDIEPVIYQTGFKQSIFLDTFVSNFSPEIDEEAEKDGDNDPIPTFQKMTMRYKVYDYVPNYVTIALVSMQMHDHVIITTPDGRNGNVKRMIVNVTPDDTGFMDSVEIIFDDEKMIKTHCNDQKPYVNVGTW